VTDGGQIVAFQARLPYGPTETADIRWQMEMVWMVQGQVDTYGADGQVDMAPVILAQYGGEPFTLSGLQVTKSAGYESAIFAVSPDAPSNPASSEQQLFQALFALNAGFLNAQQPEPIPGRTNEASALREMAFRFGMPLNQPNMDTVFRWGMNANIAADVQSYGHQDEALADLSLVPSRVHNFLNQHYPAGDTASLIFAFEESSGAISLDDLARPAGAAGQRPSPHQPEQHDHDYPARCLDPDIQSPGTGLDRPRF
jgi:hypothetical protein